MTVEKMYTQTRRKRGTDRKTNQKTERTTQKEKELYMCKLLLACSLTMWSSCGMFIRVCPLTIGGSWVPGIIALASCICWASMAMFFCWIRLFLPLISSWVFRWGGGCRYLQFSLEQRPWRSYGKVTKWSNSQNNTYCKLDHIHIGNMVSILFMDKYSICWNNQGKGFVRVSWTPNFIGWCCLWVGEVYLQSVKHLAGFYCLTPC